ncbi:MAG: hypothetical protein E7357_05870 [Clostridiales bacterium]|nr:hypothetical protein [Clostridiales bacterium]
MEDTTATQSLPVTFMPSATASDLIKTQGINVYYTFETTGTWDFDGEGGEGAKALYSVASDKYEVQMTLGADSNGDGIADFHGSIPVSVVTDAVKLNGTLILDTKDDYDLFKTALDGIKVGVTVAHDVNDEADPYQLPND